MSDQPLEDEAWRCLKEGDRRTWTHTSSSGQDTWSCWPGYTGSWGERLGATASCPPDSTLIPLPKPTPRALPLGQKSAGTGAP